MYVCTIGRRFTQMIAYFLVMNSKRCNHSCCLSQEKEQRWENKRGVEEKEERGAGEYFKAGRWELREKHSVCRALSAMGGKKGKATERPAATHIDSKVSAGCLPWLWPWPNQSLLLKKSLILCTLILMLGTVWPRKEDCTFSTCSRLSCSRDIKRVSERHSKIWALDLGKGGGAGKISTETTRKIVSHLLSNQNFRNVSLTHFRLIERSLKTKE